MDGDRGLIVSRRRKNLTLLGGDRGVLLYQPGRNATQGLDPQRKRGNVQKKDILDVAAQYTALDGSAERNHFVGVDALVGFLAEYPFNHILDCRHPGHAADQNHFIDFTGIETGILERRAAGPLQFGQQVINQGFEFGPGNLDVQMFGTTGVGGNKRQINLGFHGGGKFHLGLFSSLFQALQGHLVSAQVDALVLGKLIGQVVDQTQIEIFATQVGIPIGGFYFKYTFTDLQDGDIKGTATQVKDRNLLFSFLVQAIGQRGGRRLIDNTEHIQPGNLPGILGGLALAIVEISRNRDDGISNFLTQILFRSLFDIGQNKGRNLSRAVLFTPQVDPGVPILCLLNLIWQYLGVRLDFS